MDKTTASRETKAGAAPGGRPPPVQVPLLFGVSGRMRVDVKGKTVGAVDVQDGLVTVDVGADAGAGANAGASVVANVDDEADLGRIARGELNPIVAGIQGRLALEGDIELGMKIILSLNAAKPFSAPAPANTNAAGPPAKPSPPSAPPAKAGPAAPSAKSNAKEG